MKIHFERTGGFMGLRMVASFDTEELPEEDARRLHDLLDEIDFFELPPHLESADPGMDQFHYTLSVAMESTEITSVDFDESGAWHTPPGTEPLWDDEDSAGHRESTGQADPAPSAHTVEFTDAAALPEMQALVRLLTRLARGQST